MTDVQKKELIKSQQGELDAVLMYKAPAKAVKSPYDAETFNRLAAEEGGHAVIFKEYTGETLRPKKTLATLLPVLYGIIGKNRLYPIIAKFEYDAAKNYEHLISDFPKVESVKNDETRHGDTVNSLLK